MPTPREVAENVMLVHVCPIKSFSACLESGHCLLTTGPHSRPTTLDTERAWGMRPSVYFFAGRAQPDIGGVALAFSPDIEQFSKGFSTSCDTGGLCTKKINLNPPADETTRYAIYQGSIVELPAWREEFARYLEFNFAQLADYWFGRPKPSAPANHHGIFDNRNHWRAWTWEIHLHEQQDVLNVVAWVANEDVIANISPLILKIPLDSKAKREFFRKNLKAVNPQGKYDYCEVIEGYVSKEAGV